MSENETVEKLARCLAIQRNMNWDFLNESSRNELKSNAVAQLELLTYIKFHDKSLDELEHVLNELYLKFGIK